MAQTPDQGIDCTVQNAEILPANLGGEAGVCAIVQRILLPAVHKARLSPSAVAVSVNVKSDSMASAIATVSGVATPEQKVASSDRKLGKGAIEMLANGIADQLAKMGG